MSKSSLAFGLFLFLHAGLANTQLARVFLAGSGDDANDCSNIGTPCRSLQAPINQCPTLTLPSN